MRRRVRVVVLCVCMSDVGNIGHFYTQNEVRRGLSWGFQLMDFLIKPSIQKLLREKANMQMSMYVL